jgi:hypothetical protein
LAENDIITQRVAKRRLVSMSLVHKLSGKLRLHEAVAPLIAGWSDPLSCKRYDCCLETGIVCSVCTAVVPLMCKIILGRFQTLLRLIQENTLQLNHA